MAWVTEYDLKWIGNKNAGNIFIQRDGASYVGPLILKRGSLSIKQRLPDWESSIFRTSCTFTIENKSEYLTAYSWQQLLPLMTISEGQYRVVVDLDAENSGDPSITLFMGYLNCETVSQDMIYYSDLTLTASGLVDKLQYIEPTGILEPAHNESLINIIDYCLRLTGTQHNIRVFCSLQHNTRWAYPDGMTLFSECGVNTELFWIDNVQRENALNVLEMCLVPFNCYLYWFQGYWYIEHYEDLGTTGNRTYTEYTSGTSYRVESMASTAVVTINPLNVYSPNHQQIGNTQVLSVQPGLKQLEINLEQNKFFNMINGDLAELVEGTNPDTVYYREWYGESTYVQHYGGTYPLHANNIFGVPFKNIANSVKRNWDHEMSTANYNRGTSTKFRVTIYPDTELTIKWKHAVIELPPVFGDGTYGNPQAFYNDPGSVYVRHHWTLKINPVNVSYNTYFKHEPDISDNAWSLQVGSNPQNYKEITAAEYDQDRWVYEVEIVIPIGDEELFGLADYVDEDPVTLDLTFVCGAAAVESPDDNYWPWPYDTAPFAHEAVGDFEVTVSGKEEENLIKGEVVSNFLDKKTISIRLFNTDNWNYRNTLLTDKYGINYYINKVNGFNWGVYSTSPVGLADTLLESKFRLYRVARQKIRMGNYRVYFYEQFRPLNLWEDDKQAYKDFVLAEDVHEPDMDMHTVVLWEYDNTEEVNLVG